MPSSLFATRERATLFLYEYCGILTIQIMSGFKISTDPSTKAEALYGQAKLLRVIPVRKLRLRTGQPKYKSKSFVRGKEAF